MSHDRKIFFLWFAWVQHYGNRHPIRVAFTREKADAKAWKAFWKSLGPFPQSRMSGRKER